MCLRSYLNKLIKYIICTLVYGGLIQKATYIYTTCMLYRYTYRSQQGEEKGRIMYFFNGITKP